MRLDPIVLITVSFGVFFTIMTGLAWVQGKRLSAVFLGALAAGTLAMAFNVIQRGT